MRKISATLTALFVAALLLPSAASAALARVGPTNADGFPEWYQDKTGVTFEFCRPTNQAELDGGWCLLLPGDIIPPENQTVPPTPEVPEIFPAKFADEHFYWAADVAEDWNYGAGTARVRLVLGLEAAFSIGPPVPGEQVVFGRLRIRVDDAPVTGTYNFITPFGTFPIQGTAGQRIFETRDIGITCAVGDFSCALQSDLGPFLLPSNTPGGAEIAPVPGPIPGKLYIADPGRVGPVTGGLNGVNFFRIEGPAGTTPFQTVNFALMGRIFNGTLPAEATVDRASYTRTATASTVEGFVTANPTTAGRLPGSPPAQVVTPNLTFFTQPCGGAPDVTPTAPPGAGAPMSRNGSAYYAKTFPTVVPAEVCIGYMNPMNGDGTAAPPMYIRAPLGDQVLVTEALYSPTARTLTVSADSLDNVANPGLELLAFGNIPTTAIPANGVLTLSNIDAPPATVKVLSLEGGANEMQVSSLVRPASSVQLFANRSSPQVAGTAVQFTAVAQGSAGYQYEFNVWQVNTKVATQPYGSSATFNLPTNLPAGSYTVQVLVRTTTAVNFDVVANMPYQLTTAPAPILPAGGVTLATFPASPQVAGTAIAAIATATGGTASAYQYLFNVWQVNTKVATSTNWSTSNAWTLPTNLPAGSYTVQVLVRTSSAVSFDVFANVPYVLSAPPAP